MIFLLLAIVPSESHTSPRPDPDHLADNIDLLCTNSHVQAAEISGHMTKGLLAPVGVRRLRVYMGHENLIVQSQLRLRKKYKSCTIPNAEYSKLPTKTYKTTAK